MTRTVPRPYGALLALLSTGAALAPGLACALDAGREDVAGFVAEMVTRHGFDPTALSDLLGQAQSRQSILDVMARPAEKTLTWQEYRERFLTPRRIDRGVSTYRDQRSTLEAAARSGVPAQYILGIVGVETFYGENTGRYRVLDALATLAFDYPARAAFFRGELEQFLLMSREEALDPLASLGSYAGAMGIPQFMPTSFRKFAVDGDGDGRRDLWTDWSDVFASVGNYLKENGWKAGEPVMVPADVTGADLSGLDTTKSALTETVDSLRRRGVKFESSQPADAPAMLVSLARPFGAEYRVGFANFYAITRYNRSVLYASAVNDLAEAIESAFLRSMPPDDDASFAE